MKLTTFSALLATALSLAAVAESHSKDPYPYRKSDDDTDNDNDYSNNYRSNKVLGKLLHKSTLSSEVEPSLIKSGSIHGGTKEEENSKNPENAETVDFSGADNHGERPVKIQSTGPIGGPSTSLQFWPVKLLSLLKQLSILYTFYYDFGRATLIHLISFSGIVSLFTFIASLYGI